MENCTKSLRKLPMAIIGAIDLSVCGAVWVINHLAKRGEHAAKKVHASCCSHKCTCAQQDDCHQPAPEADCAPACTPQT